MKEIDTRSGIAQRDALTNWRKNKAVKKNQESGPAGHRKKEDTKVENHHLRGWGGSTAKEHSFEFGTSLGNQPSQFDLD